MGARKEKQRTHLSPDPPEAVVELRAQRHRELGTFSFRLIFSGVLSRQGGLHDIELGVNGLELVAVAPGVVPVNERVRPRSRSDDL